MKILAIRGKNLASLEGEFNIDFREEPLKSAGLFAITGATGAGKSTILDAICLALFNQTPRSINAESKIQIEDTNNRTVSQNDCRNILRRGTGEGYAEVEFIAPDNNHYKSTWIVRRGNNKPTGAFQEEVVKLFNLTTNEEYPEKKKNTLTRISEIIGLNFYQFTRTVLLAQGDFAAFLKASQKDKAELLEKLTGTDIYTKISMNIFARTKEADNDYKEVFRKIEGIEILSEETIAQISEEKSKRTDEHIKLESAVNMLEKKLEWIKREKELSAGIDSASSSVDAANKMIEDAADRYQFVSLFDKVQQIRDTFFTREMEESTLRKNQTVLQQKEMSLTNESVKLKDLKTRLEQLNEKSLQIKRYHESVKDEIAKARELDINIANEQKNQESLQTDIRTQTLSAGSLESEIKRKEKRLEELNINVESLKKWFDEKMYLSGIVPKIDLIVSYLEEAYRLKETEKIKTVEKNKTAELNNSYSLTLKKLNELAEELEKTLSSEIIVLRKKLIDGEPCPVCGSIHHVMTGITEDKHIQDAELNRKKEETKKQIDKYNQLIETHNRELASLDSLLRSYADAYQEAMSKAGAYLSVIPDWNTLFAENKLIPGLKKLVEMWNEKTRSSESDQNEIKVITPQINILKENIGTSLKSIDSLKKSANEQALKTEGLINIRKSMLGGKSVAEVESTLKKETDSIETLYSEAAANLNNSNGICSKLKGETDTIKAGNTELIDSISKKSAQIISWCSENGIEPGYVAEILRKDISEIKREKDILAGYKESLIKNKATLDERKENHARHQLLEYKCDTLLFDELSASAIEMKEMLKSNTERINRINFDIETNNANIKKTAVYRKELESKHQIFLNWDRLNKMFGSSDGVKFKTIAQGYTLDTLLNYANVHLKDLSERYVLQKVPGTLGVQVIDKDMMNEIRSVHSLSGGESFLLSLALALGLSSLSSNRMNVESLFIDEGFGSLDIDTLRTAMDALGRLQNQGKKIGIISHVSEMSDQIRAQVRVIKTHNGKSSIKIQG